MKSSEIRSEIVEALKLDLVGPDNTHAFAHELLPDPPTRWYLTGFLVPADAPLEQRSDETSADEIDSGSDVGGTDDAAPPDRAAARKSYLPSSMGLSVLVPPQVESLRVIVQWGDYHYEGGEKEPEPDDHGPAVETSAAELHEQPTPYGKDLATVGLSDPANVSQSQSPHVSQSSPKGYRRDPREEIVAVTLPKPGEKPKEFPVPNSRGLSLTVTTRAVGTSSLTAGRLPTGTKSVSIFLVNRRAPEEKRMYRNFAFQTTLIVSASDSFVPRPDLRGTATGELADEWDERVADLQFRDAFEYAVGHGVSATAKVENDSRCFEVRTTWIPTAEVERVAPANIPDVELGMEALGALADAAEASAKLSPLVTQFPGFWTCRTCIATSCRSKACRFLNSIQVRAVALMPLRF